MTNSKGRFCIIVDFTYDKKYANNVVKARTACVGNEEIARAAFEVYSEDGHRCCLFNLDTMEVVERSTEVRDG